MTGAAGTPILVADGDIPTTRLVARELRTSYPEVEIRVPENLFGTRFDGRPVVVSRFCHPTHAWLPAYLAARGVGYAYFLDDNFWRLTPEVDPNLAHFFGHPETLRTLDAFVRGANVVIVWSERLGAFLRDRFPDSAVEFVRPGFDLSAVRSLLAAQPVAHDKPAGVARIGYPTSRRPSVAPLLVAVVREFARRALQSVRFEFMGWMPDELADLPNAVLFPQIADYDRYLAFKLLRQWDLGLAPLVGSEFESYKTNNKYREYGGCRIPGVYSRVSPFRESVTDGVTGVLTDNTPEAWIAAIDALLAAPARREAMARAAFEDVETHYDLQVTGRHFASAMRRAAVRTEPRQAPEARP